MPTQLQKLGAPRQEIFDIELTGLTELKDGCKLPQGHMLFIGEGNKLTFYDGWTWRIQELTEAGVLRTLKLDIESSKIWVGGNEEFGYLHKSDETYLYHSLSKQFKLNALELEIIRYIRKQGDNIFFVGVSKIYNYNTKNNLLELIETEYYPDVFSFENKTYLRSKDTLSIWEKGKFILLKSNNNIERFKPRATWKHEGNEFFLTINGPTILHNYEFTHDPKNKFTFTDAIKIQNRIIANTEKNGLVIFDLNGNIIEKIVPYFHGEINNILKIIPFDQNTIWLVTRKKIIKTTISNGARIVHNTLGYPFKEIWDAQPTKNSALLANATGIIDFSNKNQSNISKKSLNYSVFKLTPFQDTYLINSVWNFSELNNQNEIKTLIDQVTSITTSLAKEPDTIWTSTRYDVRRLKKNKNEWLELNKLTGFTGAPIQIVEDNENGVWIATNSNKIYRFIINKDTINKTSYDQVAELGDNIPDLKKVGMFSLNGKPWILSPHLLFEWKENNQFDPVTFSDPKLNSLEWEWRIPLHFPQKEEIWLLRKHRKLGGYQIGKLTIDKEGKLGWSGTPVKDMAHVGDIQKIDTHIDQDGRETVIVTGSSGIDFINLNELAPLKDPQKPSLKLSNLQSKEPPDPFKTFVEGQENSPLFTFSFPHFEKDEPMFFQTRLSPLEHSWSEPTTTISRSFAGLKSGKFIFKVRSINGQGEISEINQLQFRVLPPWYKTIYAIACYILSLILILFIIFNYRLKEAKNRAQLLETKVKERTIELEKANRVKSDFVANMSHEIRNPMNGIIGGIRLLKPNEIISEKSLNSLNQRALYLSRLVNNILDFSKIESGKLSIYNEVFQASELTNTVELLFNDVAKQNNITLSVNYRGDENAYIYSDRSRIEQVLVNLISNAIRFTTYGSVRVRMNLEEINSEKSNLKLWIKDTGTGISQADQDKIFQPFQQGSKFSPKGKGEKGTGLGLAIVKDIIDRLNGQLNFSSELGKGTSFNITIPVERRSKADYEIEESVDRIKVKGKYLITEDLDYNLRIFRELMEGWGAEVYTASSGNAAFSLLEEHHFDVIFLDWDLPDYTGIEIAKMIRSNRFPINKKTPIIAQTAYSGEDQKEVSRDAGMNAFIEKPVTPEKIILNLKELCPAQVQKVSNSTNESQQESTDKLSFEMIAFMARAKNATLQEEMKHYMDTFEKILDAIKSSDKTTESEKIRSYTHQLKGHLGIIQAKTAVHYMENLIQSIDNSKSDEYTSLLSGLEEKTNQTKKEIEDQLRKAVDNN